MRQNIDEVTVRSAERAFVTEAENLGQQIAQRSDKEISELANIQMPVKQDRRLSRLLQKQGATKLTAREQKELWELMDLNRLTTLKKAFALSEISRRGL